MAKLTAKDRNVIPSNQFALPKERKYPIHDRSHAINAKARAKQQLDRGNLTQQQYNTIVRKANLKLQNMPNKSKPISMTKRPASK